MIVPYLVGFYFSADGKGFPYLDEIISRLLLKVSANFYKKYSRYRR
jgi:hypothetical protein